MSCQKTVADKINTLEDVLSVQVSLETGIAEIQSKNQLTSREISMLLGSKYSAQKSVSNSKRIKTSKLKELERISTRGYIELPSRLGDNLVFENKNDHLWHMEFDDIETSLTIEQFA